MLLTLRVKTHCVFVQSVRVCVFKGCLCVSVFKVVCVLVERLGGWFTQRTWSTTIRADSTLRSWVTRARATRSPSLGRKRHVDATDVDGIRVQRWANIVGASGSVTSEIVFRNVNLSSGILERECREVGIRDGERHHVEVFFSSV